MEEELNKVLQKAHLAPRVLPYNAIRQYMSKLFAFYDDWLQLGSRPENPLNRGLLTAWDRVVISAGDDKQKSWFEAQLKEHKTNSK